MDSPANQRPSVPVSLGHRIQHSTFNIQHSIFNRSTLLQLQPSGPGRKGRAQRQREQRARRRGDSGDGERRLLREPAVPAAAAAAASLGRRHLRARWGTARVRAVLALGLEIGDETVIAR